MTLALVIEKIRENPRPVFFMPVFLLSNKISFPPPHLAEKEGLLAIGGDLSPKRLLLAYKMGIFPWYSEDEPIMWWSPDPRMVLFPNELNVTRSLRKVIRQNRFQITLDLAFDQVITECAQSRTQQGEPTWIVEDMIAAYSELHQSGFAHSVEAWYEEKLVGGLYGVSLGRCFFGESMFTYQSNASKVAFVTLVDHLHQQHFDVIDCQVATGHLQRFGARNISRKAFLALLDESLKKPTLKGQWRF